MHGDRIEKLTVEPPIHRGRAPVVSRSTLDGISLLEELPADLRDRLAQRCRWRSFRPQQEIIGRENPTRDVYFVASGRVRVVNWSYSGREVSFEDIGAGGTFGELAAIDGEPRSAAVIALEETNVAAIDPDSFLDTVMGDPASARRLIRRLAAVIRRSTERIFELSVHGANIRIYAELPRHSEANMTGDNTAEIAPIPVHSDIAARVSTTRETVARVMGDLARRDLVVRKSDRLVVTDVDRLAELVEE